MLIFSDLVRHKALIPTSGKNEYTVENDYCSVGNKQYKNNSALKILNIVKHTMVWQHLCFGLGSSTLPRTTTRAIETDAGAARADKVAAATSSTSLYDNVGGAQPQSTQAPPKR